MKAIEIYAYHLRAELDAIDGRPGWLCALCEQFLTNWEWLLGDKTYRGEVITKHEILVAVSAAGGIYDCAVAVAREFRDKTPAVVETCKILDYAFWHIWKQVQHLYGDSEEVIMDVNFKEGE